MKPRGKQRYTPPWGIVLTAIALMAGALVFVCVILPFYTQWMFYEGWQAWSPNTCAGLAGIEPVRFRAPVAGVFLVLGLVLYAVWLATVRGGRRFDARIAAGLFVVAWLLLDIPWQITLLRRLGSTCSVYAGKSLQEKAQSGPDAGLYRLCQSIKARVPVDSTRMFIAAPNRYVGLRCAYRLYPINVMWRRGGPELPAASCLRSGDFILVTAAENVHLRSDGTVLRWDGDQTVRVALVLSDKLGALFRVL